MIACLVFIVFLGSFQEFQAQALPRAKLTVNSSLITETDSVALNCQVPAHLSVNECYFYVNRETIGSSSCMKTFTGTELLLKRKQSSSPEVEVRCFYTVKNGDVNSPSPHSDVSYITISFKPQLSVNYRKGQSSFFTCLLPGSVKHDTTCNLYFGESSRPATTTKIQKTKSSKTNQWFCWTEIQENELLRRLRLVQQKQVSCDYSLERDGKSLSPRSDPYSFSGIVEENLTEIRTTTRFTTTTTTTESVTLRTDTVFTTGTTKLTTTIPSISTSTQSESVTPTTVTVVTRGTTKPTQTKTTSSPASSDVTSTSQGTTKVNDKVGGTDTKKIAAMVGGVIVVFILVVGVCLITKRRTGKGLHNRKQTNLKDQSVWMKVTDNTEMLPVDKDGVYSVITSVPAADRPKGRGKPATGKPQIEDSDVYHVYCTIPDLPPPSTKHDGGSCLLQKH